MPYTISTKVHFDAAHRLVCGYKGKCANFHGHRWDVQVSFSARGLNRHGMVMDFGVIKKPLKDWIDENLDHGVILSPDDKKGIKMMRDAKQKIYIMPTIGWDAEGNPTSENLARVIWIAINRFPQVNRQYTMRHSVTVWETPDCSATYTNE